MNKERLNELKRKINGIAGKSDLAYQDECDLDDLIDAELSRQSVTGEEVASIQQIINALQTILDEKLTMGPNDIKELIWHLQNCTTERKPTAEEVVSIDRAIAEIIGTDYGECQIHRETLETAIAALSALRRMKGSEA